RRGGVRRRGHRGRGGRWPRVPAPRAAGARARPSAGPGAYRGTLSKRTATPGRREAHVKTLASYGLWLLIFVTCPILFVGALVLWAVTAPFDRRLRALHLYACAWASLYTYVFPYWTVGVRNRERIRDGATYVLVANHQSLLDILVLFRIYKHYKWVSKAEI